MIEDSVNTESLGQWKQIVNHINLRNLTNKLSLLIYKLLGTQTIYIITVYSKIKHLK